MNDHPNSYHPTSSTSNPRSYSLLLSTLDAVSDLLGLIDPNPTCGVGLSDKPPAHRMDRHTPSSEAELALPFG